ncbi:MAG TPA: hypothetical protein GXX25_15685 [Desulfotomaculum sp.]|nr:hypothetical protein [Desulfotomaculum sp.]
MKKFFYLLLPVLAAVLLSFTPASASSGDTVIFVVDRDRYSVNGAVYQMDARPFVEQDRVFVPLRYLARALGVDDRSVVWEAYNNTVSLYSAGATLTLSVNSPALYVNGKENIMDVAPLNRGNRLYLPARWVAGALGYSVAWEPGYQALLIGPAERLKAVKAMDMAAVKLRPFRPPDGGLFAEEILASNSILFPGTKEEDPNVYNAGVAAGYINGTILAPGQIFSYNRVVGERTAEKGFITGWLIGGDLDIGGGVCRTATLLYQLARKAGLKILERHPHSQPVPYAPPGTDATVSYGYLDLKFRNSTPHQLIFHAGLDEDGKNSRLWADFRFLRPLKSVEVAVLKESPGSCLWEKVAGLRLTALIKDGIAFVSSSQLVDLLGMDYAQWEKEGKLTVNLQSKGQSVTFVEGEGQAIVNGREMSLSAAPFRLQSAGLLLWLPLRDWAHITGSEILWLERPQPLVLLNLSGNPVAGREELRAVRPGTCTAGKAADAL